MTNKLFHGDKIVLTAAGATRCASARASGGQAHGFRRGRVNKLFYGDNLNVLREHTQ